MMEKESRPAVTGDDTFNFGFLSGVDCILMYLVGSYCVDIEGRY